MRQCNIAIWEESAETLQQRHEQFLLGRIKRIESCLTDFRSIGQQTRNQIPARRRKTQTAPAFVVLVRPMRNQLADGQAANHALMVAGSIAVRRPR